MNVTVNEVDQHKVTLHIEVPAKDASKQAAAACKNLASRVNIPGFRKGKAPRMVLESFLGKDAVKQEVFEAIANKAYSDALDQEGIVPVTEPELNVITDEKGKDVVFEATVTKKPEVKLGEYKGITVAKDKVDVTDEDVSKELVNLQKQHAKLVVAPEGTEIAKDDFAVIDFKGTVDGVAFEGGEGKSYPLQIGSGSFIPGFEDQLIGCKAGDEKDVKVTFPEDYFVKDLAGKEAIFKVNIQDVKRKELPELNDEYVASKTEFKTVEDLRANYKERMQKAAEANAKAEYEHELIDLAVANAKFSVPEIMIEDKISQMVEEMKMSLESRKMSLDMYMQYTGLDMAKIRENQRPVAEENVKTDLVLDAIAKAEDIQVDMADVDAEIAAISAQHGASPEEVKKIIKGNGTMGLLLANILRRKAAHVVIDSAK